MDEFEWLLVREEQSGVLAPDVTRSEWEDEMSETSVPRSQDFIYASFVEVVCPLCDEGALFDTKADARQWARGHKADHIDGSVARRHCGWE